MAEQEWRKRVLEEPNDQTECGDHVFSRIFLG